MKWHSREDLVSRKALDISSLMTVGIALFRAAKNTKRGCHSPYRVETDIDSLDSLNFPWLTELK